MKQQNLVTSTILLTISSTLVRTIGMISMVFLSQILGSEGIGIYELIMSVYMTAVVFASAGLSTSVSRVIAEQIGRKAHDNIHKIMITAFSFALFTGILSAALLFIGAPYLVHSFIHNDYAVKALRFLAFSIPFIACSSCFKGYFYAMQKTIYPASSDIMEQFVKLGFITFFVKLYLPLGIAYTYQAAAIGLTLGEITSWSYLCTLFLFETRKENIANIHHLSFKNALTALLKILLPIALISYISYIFLSVENILIPNSLKKFGQSFSESMSAYGVVKGMVMPLLFFPSAFLTAFSITLIPEIAKSNVLKQHTRVIHTTQRVLKLTFLLSLLVVTIFLAYSNELGFVLYKSDTVGPMLRILSIIVPFSYIEVIADGILKGLDQQVCCLKYSMIDSFCRVILLYLLLPFKGITALVGIIIASSIFTSTLNFNKLLNVTKIHFNLMDWLIKPSVSAAFAGSYSRLIVNKLFRYSLGLTTKVLLGMLITGVLYILLILILQVISPKDIAWLKNQFSLLPFPSFKLAAKS